MEYLERSADECRQIAHEVAEGFDFARGGSQFFFRRWRNIARSCIGYLGVRLSNEDVEDVARRLRTGKPAVMVRVQKNAVWLDVRTVARSQIVSLRGRLSGTLVWMSVVIIVEYTSIK